ncbi:2OG-Fe(II) oxygenase superfamily domain-containing protein [Ditylenchus destructor]|uniref:tRNA (carboxymethyluridine(34)-5-O)-methyltransferase n=1 Tax=Ditylenchus destructor TaxID=166010 RepID=A0AAD4NAD0_9BILA|nr:2OG-Fe(II) oxygenase superfamily domain-containing protein [Ditylenchus destructor]
MNNTIILNGTGKGNGERPRKPNEDTTPSISGLVNFKRENPLTTDAAKTTFCTFSQHLYNAKMVSSLKSRTRSRRVENLVKKAGTTISEIPTNILFVSNSSVLCGVPLEKLEEVFYEFDQNCSFVVFPTSKSYSFVVFSDIQKAVEACKALDGTKAFVADKSTGISLAYVSHLPEGIAPYETPSKVLEAGMKNRQVFHYGYEFNYKQNNAFAKTKPIPDNLEKLIDKIMDAANLSNDLRPDQITVNIYGPGQGIPPHTDTHSAFEEPIISLSLLSDIVMEFRDCANSADSTNVLLPSRSLLVMCGAARYRYKHGIISRKYDVNPVNNKLMSRKKRISFTFRKVRTRPCDCPFVEFCDWDRGRMGIPDNNISGQQLEQEYVSQVYEQIAEHFDETRRSKWGVVNRFLDSLPDHSVVLDAGCGNGKYLIRNDSLCKIGCDVCENLVSIAHKKECEVFRGDALCLPFRDNSIDAALSIAVIHHFSTKERRTKALSEILRVLRAGGKACVTVWSMEQSLDEQESAYAKMRSRKTDSGEENEDSSINVDVGRLKVHDGRNFKQQDMLVPWNNVNSGEQFFRYYHLFRKWMQELKPTKGTQIPDKMSVVSNWQVFESSDSTIDESEHFKPQTGAPTTEEHENKENQPKTSTKVKMPEPSFPPKKSLETLIKGKSHVTFKEAQRVTTTSSEWYFLALDDEQEARKKAAEKDKVERMLRKTQERSEMIAATSKRRAAIAANRRAVAMDVLKGKRELDDEAVRILHTDSSQISSFPRTFMEEMAEKAKRRYKQSQLRMERERGNFREKQLEMATNNVLAHSSAAIAKAVANLRFSRTHSTLSVRGRRET